MTLSKKIKESFDNYCNFLEKFEIVDREKIKKFKENKPNFIVYGRNFPGKGENKISAVFHPENNTIFLNAEHMIELSFYFEENIPYVPVEKSLPIIMTYYIGEESSHALINFLHPHLTIEAQKFLEKCRNGDYTLEEFSKVEFQCMKEEALARGIAKNYSVNIYGTFAERLVKRMYELEALQWRKELSGEESEEELNIIMEKFKTPFSWVSVYAQELEYTLDEIRKVLNSGLERFINPQEKKFYQTIKKENKSIDELAKKIWEVKSVRELAKKIFKVLQD